MLLYPKRENVMRIVHSLAPARYGGLERVVQTLSQAQAEAGHEVHIAVVVDAGDEADHPFLSAARRRDVQLHALPIPLRAYRYERHAISDLFHRVRPDVVHTHGYRADVLHGGVARRLKISTVATVHGFTAGGLKNRFYEVLQRRSYRRGGAVVAVSRPIAEQLASLGVRCEQLYCIPNAWGGTDSDAVGREKARARLGVPDDAFHVAFVGRVDRVKGADVFVEALGRLSDVPFVASVVGTDPGRGALEARALQLGIGHRMLWHGFIPDAGRWFSGFDVYVLSSRTEGTPIALLEAIAARVPIVATHVGGVPDVVSAREALLVAPERPDQLAAAIRHVYEDPEAARKRAEAARRRLEECFSIDVWVRRYDAVYEGALAATREQPRRASFGA